MKRLVTLCLIITLGLSACSVQFNPPPIATNPPAAQATQTPLVLIVPPTLTALPPTAAPSVVPTDTAAPLPTATAAPATLAPATAAPVTSTSTATALSLEQLRGATLSILTTDNATRTITLKDGKYESGSDRAKPGYISVTMDDKVAFGDLNGDGLPDAAIILAENFGGSGTYITVAAILNQAGQPMAVASALIDDRAILHAISIQAGQILVDAIIHGPTDPMCCAGLPSKRAYRLIDNSLVLAQFSTTTANGLERLIQVDSPANGTQISSPFVIKGSVTVSPFENSLGYSVFVQGAKDPVLQAGFTVKGDGLGGPGSFELPIDPAKINFKGPLRIEIADVSAADGSYLAVSTVFLILK